MLLHLGEDRVIRLSEVVALLDYSIFRRNPVNKEFLGLARSEARLERGTEAHPVETVVLAGPRVLLSSLSRHALARRAAGAWRRSPRQRSSHPGAEPGGR